MKVTQQYCFKHSSGQDVFLFTLENNVGTVVKISNYGGIILSFDILQKNGLRNDIILGFDEPGDYLKEEYLRQYPWMSCIVGRYGNRIANAAFEIEGKKYEVSKNIGAHQLHGGFEGFDKKAWKIVAINENPSATVETSYISQDGEEGFPGNLEVNTKFELNDDNELSYEYFAATDKATAVNLTHHGYFNLNNGTGDITQHELKIHALHILEQNKDLVPTGKLIAVKNTQYDFTDWKKISKDWNDETGYDQSFVADNKSNEMTLMAETRSQQSMLTMQVYSNQPVVHFYSSRWFPAIKGKRNTVYGHSSGLCLETQVHPNAINTPGFPNTILKPGEQYHHKTIYKIIDHS